MQSIQFGGLGNNLRGDIRGFQALLSLSAILVIACGANAAIDIDNHTPATNDRFANNSSFIANAYNLSGVGRGNDSGTQGWATLIDRNIFVSATHLDFHPEVGEVVYFYPDNDPGTTPIARTVAGGQQIAGTDLWVGHFTYALPSSIVHYSFLTGDMTESSFGSDPLKNQLAYMSGITPTSSGYGSVQMTQQAVGTNRIELFDEDATVSGDPSTGDVVMLVQNEPNDPTTPGLSSLFPNYEIHETDINPGDSGSPLFTVNGGDLEVVGTAWFSGEITYTFGPNEYPRPFSGYTYIGNYDAEVQTYINNNLTTVVPEPSAGLLLLMGLALPLFRRRRR
jgi:hypothetical protein